MQDEKIITLNAQNIATEHICCAIGNDSENLSRANTKKELLKKEFSKGHVFKKFDVRGKCFIEYCPAEQAWFSVNADGYTFIQCFWVSGKFKGTGMGAKLLEECEKDSLNTNGLVIISSKKKKPFVSDKKYMLSKGFSVCDSGTGDFELLVKKFNPQAADPRFTDSARLGIINQSQAMTFIYSDMCPFAPVYSKIMANTAQEMGIAVETIKLSSPEHARQTGVLYGIFSLYDKGRFITNELMTEEKFRNYLKKLGY
ncbi:MAG TPA: YoaP domain-containing protein [Petrotogaceae bacterium]|nr:YoaP domain-containing protein [Petrotogaceae bacterium]